MSNDDELFEREVGGPPSEDQYALAWEWRVFAVALFWILPGFMTAALVCLVVPSEYRLSCLVAGGLLGFAAGGLLEADYWG
ncbi:MAG TPA: hypothetical protein VKE40_15160 [Gemmataceae bacterium]|nr:hypothetical protein [Gemmataceae bacterium]